MPGFNPLMLCSVEVGLKDGWRLLHEDEIEHMHHHRVRVYQKYFAFLRNGSGVVWDTCDGVIGGGAAFVCKDGFTYRTKLTKEQVLALQ